MVTGQLLHAGLQDHTSHKDTYFCAFLITCLKQIEKVLLDIPSTTANTLAGNWSVNQIFQKFHRRNVRLLLQNFANEQQAAFFQSDAIMPLWKKRPLGGRGLLIHGGVLLQFVEKNAKTSRTAQKLHFQFIYSHHASKVLSTAALHQALKIWGSGLMKSSSARNVVSIYKLEVELSSVWVVFFYIFLYFVSVDHRLSTSPSFLVFWVSVYFSCLFHV